MEIYETEEQQINALKNWWKANSNSVISGVVGGVIVLSGWNFWQSYKQDSRLQASSLFEQLLVASEKKENESVKKIAERIEQQYSSTPYADFAQLYQAKTLITENDLDAAKQVLKDMAETSSQEMSNVANIRLIRLLLATGEYEQGLQLIAKLDQQSIAAFKSNYEELKGDLYVALDRPGEARTAYENALREGAVSPLLQYKIDDLTAPEIVDDNS